MPPTDRPSPHAADAASTVVGFNDPVRGQTHFTVAEYFPSDIRERMRREGRITVDRDWFYRVVNGAIVGHDAGTPVKSGGTLTMWLVPYASAAPAPPQQQAPPPGTSGVTGEDDYFLDSAIECFRRHGRTQLAAWLRRTVAAVAAADEGRAAAEARERVMREALGMARKQLDGLFEYAERNRVFFAGKARREVLAEIDNALAAAGPGTASDKAAVAEGSAKAARIGSDGGGAL